MRKTDNAVEIVIWQHPKEVNHPKNSARLLQLSLSNVRTLIAEDCDEQRFQAWCADDSRTNILLSPLGNGDYCASSSPVPLDQLRVIIIDGTWRKARKICYLNPWLQTLPSLALSSDYQSRYAMRKPEHAGQYSTLEAACLALIQIEENSSKYQPLLAAFEQLNRRWEAFRR